MTDFNRSLAFVIGIDQYANGIAPLQSAVNDAKALAQLLKADCGYQVQLLLDRSATLSQLIHLLQTTLPVEVGSDDRVLFYFAGHGVAIEADDGPAGYLIPQDACPNDTSTFLPMRELHDALTALPCRHLLAILDCCFSGAFRWSSLKDVIVYSEVVYQERYDRFIRDPAWQVITSSAYDQEALDILQDTRGQEVTQRHSPFAKALLDALRGGADLFPPSENGQPAGDGVITATELYLYLRHHVELASEARYRRQTPGLWPLRRHDKGEYIFLVPGHELNLPPAPKLNSENNPYRGLESFEQDHAKLFFGRDRLIQELQAFVAVHPLTVVLGASGTGKSSLVKAGLIPQLQNSVEPGWHIFPATRPGESPLKALARTILSLRGADKSISEIESLSKAFAHSPEKLEEILAEWSQYYPRKLFLLVIDQFEELALCRNQLERKTFIELLKLVLSSETIQGRVVLTLRSDFEPQFLDSPLKPNWGEARFIVPPMTQDELRQAIEGPAAERVLYFEPPSLVDRLINEVVQMPGALPLLSFTLSELYFKYLERRSDNRSLTQEDYHALGGVAGSLTQRATQEYEKLVQQEPAYAQTIKRVMLRMVALEGGELTRRRVLHVELVYPNSAENERVKMVILQLTKARLLVEGRDPDGEPYVEPAHDALIQGWNKLQQWKNQEQESLAIRGLLAPVAREWNSRQQPSGLLWNANPRLNLLRESLKSPDSWLNNLETDFIKRSLNLRRNNRFFRTVAFATFITGVSIASVIAFWQQNLAMRREIANLNASSENRLSIHDQLGALMDSVEAGQKLEEAINGLNGLNNFMQGFIDPYNWAGTQIRTTAVLHQVLSKIKQKNRLEGHSDKVNSVSFSSCVNGKQLIASGSADGTLKLWDSNGTLLHNLRHGGEVTSVSFSSDCNVIATAGYDHTVKLRHRDGTLLHTFQDDDWVKSIDFSPNGNLIASGNAKGQVKLWNRDKGLIRTIGKHNANTAVTSVSFSSRCPNGKQLIAASEDKTIKIWDLNGQLYQTLKDISEDISSSSVSFSPDCTMLVSANDNGKIKLWTFNGSQYTLSKNLGCGGLAHNEPILHVRFSPDGQLIASAGQDGLIKLWRRNGDKDEIATLEGHSSYVTSVGFSPDGSRIVSASADNTVRVWSINGIPKGEVTENILENDISTTETYFSSDGQNFASLRKDKTVVLGNLNGGTRKILRGQNQPIDSINFSQNKMLVSLSFIDGGKKTLITLWSLDGKQIKTFEDKPLNSQSQCATKVSLSPDGKTVALASSDNIIKLWNVNDSSVKTLDRHSNCITSLKFSPDSNLLASAGEDKKIMLWNREGQFLNSLDGYSQSNETIDFSRDGQILAALANDEVSIKLWNRNGKELALLRGHNKLVNSVSFSPDGSILASTSQDHTVRLWRSNGDELRVLVGHSNDVTDAIFNPAGNVLASVGRDDRIKLWSIDGVALATFTDIPHDAWAISFAENGSKLVIANKDVVKFWNLNQVSLVQSGCQWLSEYLSTNNSNQNFEKNRIDKFCKKYLK